VIHFAAFAYVGESMRAPNLYFRNNVVGTLELLDVMREEGVRQIFFHPVAPPTGNLGRFRSLRNTSSNL